MVDKLNTKDCLTNLLLKILRSVLDTVLTRTDNVLEANDINSYFAKSLQEARTSFLPLVRDLQDSRSRNTSY